MVHEVSNKVKTNTSESTKGQRYLQWNPSLIVGLDTDQI